MRRFVLQCDHVRSFPDFVAAVNEGLVRPAGGEWNGNLDAFNDYLCWPEGDHYELEVVGSSQCADALGHEAMAAWLRDCLATCHPSNVEALRARLVAAERRTGETLWSLICEIIGEKSHVHLVQT